MRPLQEIIEMKLNILDLSFSYDSVKVLRNVSLKVKTGEILGIIGPNGSGKTTLVKCINRNVTPEAGAVLVDDDDIMRMSRKEIAKNIGVVPQISLISFPFTVYDIIMMGRYSHTKNFCGKDKKNESIVRQCMELTSTVNMSDRLITEISGGEYQRVIIARAMAQEPKVLLLDEPTLHLDINHQIEILELVRSLAKNKNLTVIMVMHDLSLAARYSDNIIMLNNGSIFDSGAPEQVINTENIKDVYGIEVEINRNNKRKYLNVIPLSIVPDKI